MIDLAFIKVKVDNNQLSNIEDFTMSANIVQILQQSPPRQTDNLLVNQLSNDLDLQLKVSNDAAHIDNEMHKLQSSIQMKRALNQSQSVSTNKQTNQPKNIGLQSMFRIFEQVQKDVGNQQKLCDQPYTNLLLQSTDKLELISCDSIQFIEQRIFQKQDYDIEPQQSYTDMPLRSITKFNNSSFQGPSQNSDNINYYARNQHHKFNSITSFNQNVQSQELSSFQQLLNCRKCHILEQTNKQLTLQLNDLAKKLFPLNEPHSRIRKQSFPSSTNSNEQDYFNVSLKAKQDVSQPQLFLQQLKIIIKIMEQIGLNKQNIQFNQIQEGHQMFTRFQILFPRIKKLFLIQQQEVEQPKKTNKIHEKYIKLIQKLKSQHRQQIDKLGQDFKNFMGSLVQKNAENMLGCLSRQNKQLKGEFNLSLIRKMKTLEQKEDKLQHRDQYHNKQITELYINYQKQKNKAKNYERYYKKIFQRHNHEMLELKRQRNYFKETAKRYQKEFEAIMLKIAKSNVKLEINGSDLFKNIGQRVFQISNCIPFEQNDEQNLFVPENETQLYDMLQRIRHFYLQIEEFSAKKEREVFILKKNFIIFLKDLIENDKISIRYTIELISRNKDLGLDYIKDYVNSLRKKRVYSPKKHVSKNLTLIQTQSYNYLKGQEMGSQKQI